MMIILSSFHSRSLSSAMSAMQNLTLQQTPTLKLQSLTLQATFCFRCKDGIPANLNLYAIDIENERTTVENAFSKVTVSVILSDFGKACGHTSKLVWLRLLTLFHHLHPDDDKSQISIAECSF